MRPVLTYATGETKAFPARAIGVVAITVLLLSLMDVGVKRYCRDATIDFGYDGKKPAATKKDAVARFYIYRIGGAVHASRYCALCALALVSAFGLALGRRNRTFEVWIMPSLAWLSLTASFFVPMKHWTALYHPL